MTKALFNLKIDYVISQQQTKMKGNIDRSTSEDHVTKKIVWSCVHERTYKYLPDGRGNGNMDQHCSGLFTLIG